MRTLVSTRVESTESSPVNYRFQLPKDEELYCIQNNLFEKFNIVEWNNSIDLEGRYALSKLKMISVHLNYNKLIVMTKKNNVYIKKVEYIVNDKMRRTKRENVVNL